MLRTFIRKQLPVNVKEKISYNVPFFYGNKGICIVWPSSIPRGGIKSGVLMGFWYGIKLKDKNNYLIHGTNKQIFYKIFNRVEDIEFNELAILLKEAYEIDSKGK